MFISGSYINLQFKKLLQLTDNVNTKEKRITVSSNG